MKYSKDAPRDSITVLIIAALALAILGTIIFGTASENRGSQRERTYTLFPANSELIRYNGRWLPTPNRQGKLASFPCKPSTLSSDMELIILQDSSLDFIVYNTTYIVLDLANLKNTPERKIEAQDNANQIALTPKSMKLGRYGPIDVLVTMNGTALSQRLSGIYGKTMVVRNLNALTTHRIRVKLDQFSPRETIHVNGIILEDGGHLLPDRSIAFELPALSNQSRFIHPRKLVEILTTNPLEYPLSSSHIDHPNFVLPWSDLLEQKFANTTFSVVSFPNNTCLSRLCQAQGTTLAAMKDTYFRAGALDTPLHNRLWSPTLGQGIPSASFMLLGLADVEFFLRKARPTKHQTAEFIEDFARGYSSFIQTIRRTAYSSSVLESLQSFTSSAFTHEIDESYLYNSASSGVPIFLIIPPYPSHIDGVRARYMRTLLGQGLQKVLNELKWHIGDKKTFIIDTAGWLEDEDFVVDNEHVRYALSQSGHAKFAYRVSLHLCQYLRDEQLSKGTSKCPFAKHDEYIGNLYVPETASLGKIVQERKIARVKKLFGLE